MSTHLHHQTDIHINRRGGFHRRDFLRAISAAGAASGLLSWPDLMALRADELRKRGRACILLWMQGGPSQFETFSPKPDHENGGQTKAIDTAVSGIQISENLPEVAKVMQDVCLIRSMKSKEGSHPRATYLLHTGYLPTASVKYPTLGSIAAHELGDPSFDLPGCVRIGASGQGGSIGGGLLGNEFDPFFVQNPNDLPSNTKLPTSESRFQRRVGLLDRLQGEYEASGGRQEVSDQKKLYAKASKLILSPKMDTFDISKEPAKVRDAYSRSAFGAGCLLARRLVETGVTFVEVNAGNWDTHDDNFNRSKKLCEDIDQPFAELIRDLKQRGLFDKTLIVWMGEFGRTPRVNPRGGRDHYPRAFNVALAGGGVKGGQVIGATDAGGSDVKDRPVGVADLFRTICHSLQIDANRENMSSIGRPIKIVDGGEVVKEVFG